MTSPVGFLDFFVLEASEYIEQLDGLVSAPGGLAAEPLQRTARALRGSATMAKLPPFSDLAAAIERVGRGLREGRLAPSPALSAALVAAVDDLKILVRGARNWADAETQRAAARTAELGRYVPAEVRATPTPTHGGTTAPFLVTEAANIAAGLDLLIARPTDAALVGNVLGRLRALRGVAAIKDLPPVPEVLEAAEQAAHPLELGRTTLRPEQREVLESAAAVLRESATALQRGQPLSRDGAAATRLARAVDALHDASGDEERIVPVSALFYEDGGPTVVSAAPTPTTSPAERFRLETVSQGEHLRRLVSEARSAADAAARERYRRELRRALRELRIAAESYGEHGVAAALDARIDALAALDDGQLELLRGLAELLANPTHSAPLEQQLAAIASRPDARPAAPAPAAAAAPAAAPAAMRMTPPPPAAIPTRESRPSGPQLAAMLDAGLSQLRHLDERPLTPSAPLDTEPVVPVEQLVYRGRAALRRAVEVRDALRQRGGAPAPEALDELFDLLDLALVD